MIEVICSSNSTKPPTHPAAGNCSRNRKSKPKQKGNRNIDEMSDVDYVVTKANSSQGDAQLYILKDNEAVIKDDHQRKKSDDETRVKNPQSRVRLVI